VVYPRVTRAIPYSAPTKGDKSKCPQPGSLSLQGWSLFSHHYAMPTRSDIILGFSTKDCSRIVLEHQDSEDELAQSFIWSETYHTTSSENIDKSVWKKSQAFTFEFHQLTSPSSIPSCASIPPNQALLGWLKTRSTPAFHCEDHDNNDSRSEHRGSGNRDWGMGGAVQWSSALLLWQGKGRQF